MWFAIPICSRRLRRSVANAQGRQAVDGHRQEPLQKRRFLLGGRLRYPNDRKRPGDRVRIHARRPQRIGAASGRSALWPSERGQGRSRIVNHWGLRKRLSALIVTANVCLCLGLALAGLVPLPIAAPLALLLSLAAVAAVHQTLQPLVTLAESSKRIVDNPIMRHVYTGRGDEIGQLQLALKMYQARLRTVVRRIEHAARELAGQAASTNGTVNMAAAAMEQQRRRRTPPPRPWGK